MNPALTEPASPDADLSADDPAVAPAAKDADPPNDDDDDDDDDNDEEEGTALESVIRHNLGLIHAEGGRTELALEEYGRSRDIKVALAGESHPEVAVTLNAMGALHGTMGEKDRALAHFRQALHIFRMHSAELGDDDPSVVSTIRNIRLIERSSLMGGREDRLTMD